MRKCNIKIYENCVFFIDTIGGMQTHKIDNIACAFETFITRFWMGKVAKLLRNQKLTKASFI